MYEPIYHVYLPKIIAIMRYMLKLSTMHILAILHRISNQAESVADLEDYK